MPLTTEESALTAIDSYRTTRSRTLDLVRPLNPEDTVPQVVDHASPPKWHLAHTTWFFEEFLLSRFLSGYQRFHPEYGYLFNSYYNAIGERTARNLRGAMTRPGINEVLSYRSYVDEEMERLFSETDVLREWEDILITGIQHEQQHQELLLTDLKLMFSLNPMHPVYRSDRDLTHCSESPEAGWVEMEDGIYSIGHKGSTFCFDNELGEHRVFLEPYRIAKGLVTNDEYLHFMRDGGYERAELWLDEGWSWVREHQVKTPLYWFEEDFGYAQYTLGGVKEIVGSQPLCHVNFYEADAFARWSGHRLPTEFEWEAAQGSFNWGHRWEWSNSAYLPYPSFKTVEGALGEYNGKFMVNQMVLRGASMATAQGHSRATYRNFFHPHFRWQFSGIRLAGGRS